MFETIFSKPRLLLLTMAVLTALALAGFGTVTTTNRVDRLLEDQAEISRFETLESCFGQDQSMLLSFRKITPGMEFSGADLKLMRKVVLAVEDVRGISGVSSLLDYLNFRRDEESFSRYLTDTRIEKFNEEIRVLSIPAGLMISRNLERVGLIVNLKDAKDSGERGEIVRKLRERVSRFAIPGGFHLFGYPVFESRYFELIGQNNKKLLGISLFFCLAVAYLLFRRLSTVGVVLLSVAPPPLLTFGLYFYQGNGITMLTSLIIPLCLVISLNTAIYILNFHFKNSHLPGRGLQKTFSEVLKPCFLASFTTFAGFFSLCVTPSHDLRLFGAYCSLATLFSFFAVFGVVFSFLRLGFVGEPGASRPGESGPAFTAPSSGKGRKPGLGKRLYRSIARVSTIYPRLLIAAGTLMVLAAVWALSRAQFRCGLEDTFLSTDPVLADARAAGDDFSGGFSISVIIEHPDMVEPRVLEMTRKFQRRLLESGKIRKTLSIIELIEDFCTRFSPEENGIPTKKGQIDNILNFFESRGVLKSHLSRYRDILRVRVWPETTDYFEILALADEIRKIAGECLPADARTDVSGRVFISALIQKKMTFKALSSLGFSMAAILMIIGVLFGSLRVALFSLAANVAPLAIAYGTAVSAGFPLNVSTTIVGTVMMGLIVDDTIHFLHFHAMQRKKGRSTEKAILNTLRNLIRPITFTSVILLTGTMIFTLADFRPIINFGAISSIVIALAWIFDILILPAMIIAVGRINSPKKELPSARH